MGQKQTGHFKHTYDNGDTYDGEFVNGKRQGRGVYTSAGGHKYEGEWHDDQRHGFGIFTFTTTNPDGSTQWQGTYEGEWKNNLKEGPGTFNYASVRARGQHACDAICVAFSLRILTRALLRLYFHRLCVSPCVVCAPAPAMSIPVSGLRIRSITPASTPTRTRTCSRESSDMDSCTAVECTRTRQCVRIASSRPACRSRSSSHTHLTSPPPPPPPLLLPSNGDRVTGRWQDDVQDGLSVFVSADGSLREEQWEAGERMTSRAIGSADPLSISSQLDAERIQRKVSMDIAQWHLVQRQHASASGILDTVSPRIAPEPRGSIQGTAHEMLEKLAIMQAQAGVGQEKQTTGHADSGAVHVSESVHSDSDPAAPAAAAVVVPDHKSPSHATAAAHLALSKERDSQPEHVDIDELAKELQDENLE